MADYSSSNREEQLARIAAAAAGFTNARRDMRRQAAIAYMFEIAEFLTLESNSEAIIQPLLEVIPFVANPAESGLFDERRSATSEPSISVLARASATIDVHVSMGKTLEEAAQTVARQLINARSGLPSEGDDARGWKRLLTWHTRLTTQMQPPEAWSIYQELARELERLPRRDVVRLASEGRLWNDRAPRNSET